MFKRKNKFNAKKTWVDGQLCDSKKEAKHYAQLLILEKANEIVGLKLHPRYPILINGVKICNVVLDFEFIDLTTNKKRHIDVKGVYTSESKLRHKLLEATHNIKVEIWK